jgi:hypothetical protein
MSQQVLIGKIADIPMMTNTGVTFRRATKRGGECRGADDDYSDSPLR